MQFTFSSRLAAAQMLQMLSSLQDPVCPQPSEHTAPMVGREETGSTQERET